MPLARFILLATVCTAAFGQQVPRTSDRPWTPPHPQVLDQLDVTPREAKADSSHVYTLGELVDLAESTNPVTRLSWARAKVAASSLGIARSELYPTLSAVAIARTVQDPLLLNEHFQLQDLGLFKSLLSLRYTIFDFGARSSEIQAAKARLLAENFRFNDAHLHVIYQVVNAYYRLQNAIGLNEAAAVNLTDAKAVEQAAQERLDNGLATLPDVLEARAASAKADYDLQNAVRNEQVVFGDLATILTISPEQSFHVQKLSELSIPDSLAEPEELFAKRALKQRPDLLAGASRVNAATAEIKHAKSAYFPTLEFEGDSGWIRAWGQQEKLPSTYGQVKIYDARVSLRWTIFDGLRRENEVAKAKAERIAAQAEVQEQEDRIANEVWRAYRDAETSFIQRKAATAFLKASSESYDAALDAYRYGVRNILDVLAAERQLAQARAAEITARTEVLNTVKNLAFRTGDLLTAHPSGNKP